jgi:predicted RNase H-like nuclease
MKKYAIHNLTTGEILADNLQFADLPELFGAYVEFYPNDEIVAVYTESRIVFRKAKPINIEEMHRNSFISEWFEFMDELITIGNLSIY